MLKTVKAVISCYFLFAFFQVRVKTKITFLVNGTRAIQILATSKTHYGLM